MGQSSDKKRGTKRDIIIFSVALLIIFGTALTVFEIFHRGKKINTASSEPAKETSKIDYADFLVFGIDDTNDLTDVIMLLSIDNTNKKVSILQIPRDTYVDKKVPTSKYNAVYNHPSKGESGEEALINQIEKDFGVKISNYAAVTTSGFRSIVDSIGGVDINVPINMNYDDDGQNLHIHLKKGTQHLDGSQAEQFVRYRKGWSQGDVGRLSAQRLFLAAFTQKLKDYSTIKLAADVLPSLKEPNFKTDISVTDGLTLFSNLSGIDLDSVEVFTMPGEYYTSDKGLSVYSVHKSDLLKILNSNFVPNGTVLTEDNLGIKETSSKEKSSASSKNLGELLH